LILSLFGSGLGLNLVQQVSTWAIAFPSNPKKGKTFWDPTTPYMSVSYQLYIVCNIDLEFWLSLSRLNVQLIPLLSGSASPPPGVGVLPLALGLGWSFVPPGFPSGGGLAPLKKKIKNKSLFSSLKILLKHN
jgi:hypothetical protein